MRLATRTLTTFVLVGICLAAFTVASPIPGDDGVTSGGSGSTGDNEGSGESGNTDKEIIEWARKQKEQKDADDAAKAADEALMRDPCHGTPCITNPGPIN
ncbi:hypothetical protein BJ684DRAFT_18782 [Piptocephalis cylindrospora]|uniref:Secreted protein n=1 Tax=Piptocephalis cylindrospora TaxID=1907219 RepID=A0A4P9Y714_9FUNG|nr:hypothetical protein BJ684DRAFT_18782 [Piptocephalis cylindrospora]|eukprot:RKP14835.1 hypothetical protein BJ684DRAFT_18782 [Piptocephalis cylindrospora]